MAKITKATLKSFIRKNKGKLYIMNKSNFDGMQDMVTQNYQPKFTKADYDDWASKSPDNTLGIRQIWLVGSSRDYFEAFDGTWFEGISVSNSCGSFIVAIRKDEPEAGKVYSLTGTGKSIANGNTWAESVVK